jgi:transposase
MPKKALPDDPKAEALRKFGCLHPNADRVRDPLFADIDFFDARDVVQVKYEMVRRVQVDGQSITQVAAAFGFSRPSFYEAQAAVARGGLLALVPQKRGPRGAHKLSTAVIRFLRLLLAEQPSLRPPELAERVRAEFGIDAHPRSIERALVREEKKR